MNDSEYRLRTPCERAEAFSGFAQLLRTGDRKPCLRAEAYAEWATGKGFAAGPNWWAAPLLAEEISAIAEEIEGEPELDFASLVAALGDERLARFTAHLAGFQKLRTGWGEFWARDTLTPGRGPFVRVDRDWAAAIFRDVAAEFDGERSSAAA